MILLGIISVFFCIIFGVSGFGRLAEPAGRSSAWRYGFQTPINYDDNQLNCGGWSRQIGNGGKCGVCGDPWDGKRENEAGGKYATGTIVKQYMAGEVILVRVETTSSCLGWFEFRLCPNDNVSKPVTQDCLDRHLLTLADTSETRYRLNSSRIGYFDMKLKLPDGLTCTQCVLQWKNHCGNNWGTDATTGNSCVGCGIQQEIYNCADIAIVPKSNIQTGVASTTDALEDSDSQGSSGQQKRCRAINNWAGQSYMDTWCTTHCAVGNCPELSCDCSPPTTLPSPPPTAAPTTTSNQHSLVVCRAINFWAGNSFLDRWCAESCARGQCPETSCKCTREAASSTTRTTAATPTLVTPTTRTTAAPPTVVANQRVCKAIGIWKDIDVFDRWCTQECNSGNCPNDTCVCVHSPLVPLTALTTEKPSTTVTVSVSRRCSSNGVVAGDYWNQWCQKQCDRNDCPTDYCNCN